MNEIAKSYPEIILGFIFISFFLGLLKFVFSQYVENKKVSLQKIELMNNILKFNLNKPNARQKFITEQVFTAAFGKAFIFKEIKALLNYESPSEIILLFIKGRRYLQVSKSGKSFVLNKKYRRYQIFKMDVYLQNVKYFMLYMIFSLLIIFPVTILHTTFINNSWFDTNFNVVNIFWAFIASSIALLFAALAVTCLFRSGKIAFAFKLIEKNS